MTKISFMPCLAGQAVPRTPRCSSPGETSEAFCQTVGTAIDLIEAKLERKEGRDA